MSDYDAIVRHYLDYDEAGRLFRGAGILELPRTQAVIARFLSPTPSVIWDVGGGPGTYATWLAGLGHAVHLVDVVPSHIDAALQAATDAGVTLQSAHVGDARHLDADDGCSDLTLLLGPLYHLQSPDNRLAALREAVRITKPGGMVVAAGISRFASALDGMAREFDEDPVFVEIIEQDLRTGRHQNRGNPRYFTDAYFHRPDELAAELSASGLHDVESVFVEGPAATLPDLPERLADEGRRARLLRGLERLESEPSLSGTGFHLLAFGRVPLS